jgi:outer membrane scaffolding protein for murein synthesis (MipA/OmpV family)
MKNAAKKLHATAALFAVILATNVPHEASALSAKEELAWAGRVGGIQVTTVNFPGSESYSFVTSPALTRHFSGLPNASFSRTMIGDNGLALGVMPQRPLSGFELDLARQGMMPLRDAPALFAELSPSSGPLRLKAEGRMGLFGSNGFGGLIGADYIHRLSDAVVIAGGPRLAVTGNDYVNTVYGITLSDPMKLNRALSGKTDTMRFVGAGASLNFNNSGNTSTTFYATFDRMMANPADQQTNTQTRGGVPAQNQFSFGAQFNYSFGGR